jgi:hypothetical protein
MKLTLVHLYNEIIPVHLETMVVMISEMSRS